MWLNVIESRSAIKLWGHDIWDVFIPNTWPILDTVIKLNTEWQYLGLDNWGMSYETALVKILIEQIIISDGLSLWKLDLSKVRNSFTLKWAGKISVKDKKTDLPDLASDFTDLWLEVAGLPMVKSLVSIWKRIASKTRFTKNMTHSSPFSAALKQWGDDLWKLTHVIHKWKKYIEQWDENKFQKFDVLKSIWKPVLRSSSELDIWNIWDKQLATRLNIPLFELSRDHARDTVIRVFTILSLVDESQRKQIVFTDDAKLNLWPYVYKTVLST